MPDDIKSNVDGLELYSDEYPFRLPLKRQNFENEADRDKFIKCCERLIRSSLEYKDWRNYIVDVLGITTCMITSESIADCTVDVHHHIPSLFTVVKAVIYRHIDNELHFSTFDVCDEVIKLHFKNKIGYTTLISSIHEKFHNGMLTIPISVVRGNYNSFITEYSAHLEEDDLEQIQERISITENNCNWSKGQYIING